MSLGNVIQIDACWLVETFLDMHTKNKFSDLAKGTTKSLVCCHPNSTMLTKAHAMVTSSAKH